MIFNMAIPSGGGGSVDASDVMVYDYEISGGDTLSDMLGTIATLAQRTSLQDAAIDAGSSLGGGNGVALDLIVAILANAAMEAMGG